MAKLSRRSFIEHSMVASAAGLAAGSSWSATATAAQDNRGQEPAVRAKTHIDLMKTLPEFFKKWKAGGAFPPPFFRGENGEVVMYWANKGGLATSDEGQTWHEYRGKRKWPEEAAYGTFRVGEELVAVTTGIGGDFSGDTGGLFVRRSTDDGSSWSGQEPIPKVQKSPQYPNLRGPFVFSVELTGKGRIIIPEDYLVGREGPDPDVIGTTVSDDGGRTWQRAALFGPPDPLPKAPEGFGEPAVAELADGTCWMVFRSLFGHLWQATSTDGGLNWGPPCSTGLASTLANAKVRRIPGSDAVVLFWNNGRPGPSRDFGAVPSIYRPRSPLVLAVSGDNCRSWSPPVTVYEGTGVYPSTYFSEKSMFVAYMSNPDPATKSGASYGLTVSVYDTQAVANLPPWTQATIGPYIADGRVAHWLAMTAR